MIQESLTPRISNSGPMISFEPLRGRQPEFSLRDLVSTIKELLTISPQALREDASLISEAMITDFVNASRHRPVSVKTIVNRLEEHLLRPALPHPHLLAGMIGPQAASSLSAFIENGRSLKGRLFFVFRHKIALAGGRIHHFNTAAADDGPAPAGAREAFVYCLVSPGGRQRFYHFSKEANEKKRLRGLVRAVMRHCDQSLHVGLIPVAAQGPLAQKGLWQAPELESHWGYAPKLKQTLHVHPLALADDNALLQMSTLRFAVSSEAF